jgi:tight adherence protein C
MTDLFSFSTSVHAVEVLALAVASTVLVGVALRLRHARAEERIALIDPWTHPIIDMLRAPVGAREEAGSGANLDKEQREFAYYLRRWGISTRSVPTALLTTKILCAAGVSVASWLLAPRVSALLASPLFRAAVTGGCGFFGWYGPGVYLRWMNRRRAVTIVSGLPDALELLVICAEGGLALGDGIDRIVTELRGAHPELADELAVTGADLKILPSQDQALSRLAARIDVPIVQSLVTTLIQTMRYGTPLAQALRAMGAEMRNDSLIRLEARANSLPSLLTIPMIVFILPTIFLVLGGPAILRLIDQFHH